MAIEEAVETPAEVTAPTESAPVETETTDTQGSGATQESAPTESDQSEKKVSESVPYERFKEVNDRLKELEQQLTPAAPAEYATETQPGDLPFDEATLQGLESFFEQKYASRREVEEAQQFVKKYADDLKDPIVDSRTKDLIRQGVDREQALNQAKKELEERLNPIQKEALAQGVQEGQQLANKKEQMGAIGTPGSSGKVDPNTLSSAEYAKFYGLSRVE